jgi:hypothetical protein
VHCTSDDAPDPKCRLDDLGADCAALRIAMLQVNVVADTRAIKARMDCWDDKRYLPGRCSVASRVVSRQVVEIGPRFS